MGQPTIFALSSGSGKSAVAVVRVSGPAVPDILQAIAGGMPPARMAAYRRLRDPATGDTVDRGLVLYFPAPDSFTGEACCEFQVHGSVAVVRRLLAVLAVQPNCRMAEPGEFAQRAFASGKLDLPQVEALADLIDAETDRQRQLALQGAGGALGAKAEIWRERLLDLAAEIEARIDFSDEGDVDERLPDAFRRGVRKLRAELSAAAASLQQGLILREGFRVVIGGPPNAGKSSLMNAMARRDVAIVSATPGTTRDRIDVRMDLNGVPISLTDTAGIRATEDEIEQTGIDRATLAMSGADLVVWLTASDSAGLSPVPVHVSHVVHVLTKSDLPLSAALEGVPFDAVISTRTSAGLDQVEALIARAAEERLSGGEALIAHARQAEALGRAVAALDDLLADPGLDLAVQAEHLRRAMWALDHLLGRVGVEEVLGAIFSRFCIGK